MVSIGKRRGPRIRAAAHSGNRRMVDALVGTSGDGGMVPQMMADAFQSGQQGALEVEDFFEELLKRDRGKGKRVLERTLTLLPEETKRTLQNPFKKIVPVQERQRPQGRIFTTVAEPGRQQNFEIGSLTGRKRPSAEDDAPILAANEARPRVKPPAPERREASSENVPRPRVGPTVRERTGVSPEDPIPTTEELAEELDELFDRVSEGDPELRRSMISPAKAKKVSGTRWDDEILENIVKREAARLGYLAVGGLLDEEGDRALGRYQLVRDAREDIGLQDAQGRWTGKWGVNSAEEFLNNPVAQEKAMDAFLERTEIQLKNKPTRPLDRIGTKVQGVLAPFEITEAGLLAAGHRRGTGMVSQYVRDMAANGWRSDEARWAEKNRLGQFREVEKRLREFEDVSARRSISD